MLFANVSLWTVLTLTAPAGEAVEPFAIEVVDRETGRGVPMVQLETVNHIRLYTDSNGLVAFHEPGLMNGRVFFHVTSHGYEHPAYRFGYRWRALVVTPGGQAKIEIDRINVAQRLYRVTGGGIYRHSELVGRPTPTQNPQLNGLVLGSDSVQNAVYRGKIFWLWGDTNRPAYPLGNFNVPAAFSQLPGEGGLDPDVGIDLTYFLDESGFAKKTAPLEARGPTWLSSLFVLREADGRQRLFSHYVNVTNNMKTTERGLVEFDDQAAEFKKVAEFPLDGPFLGGAQAFPCTVDGTDYVYFANPYPLTRVEATAEKLKRLENYEAFTPLEAGSRLGDERFDRHQDGSLRWGWKADTDVVHSTVLARLVKTGQASKNDGPFGLRDVDTGKPVMGHRGSVYFNEYRNRYVMIACETFGTSMLGETWYAEADRPEGPWLYARKIITHERYSFYNPKQHPMFDQQGGRVIYLEGTYTATFSGNSIKTPWYDYNQILYKLELDDPRLNLPVAVYDVSGEDGSGRYATLEQVETAPIAFWALDRAGENTAPVPGTDFHALPPDTEDPPPTTVPLYEYRHADGRRVLRIEGASAAPGGFVRSPRPIARVWRGR